MARTIIVGDVHGCRAELEELLAEVAFASDDRLVMVGDLVVRGPDPRGTLALVRLLGARVARGNHEDRLLRYRADPRRFPVGERTRATAASLAEEDWAFLKSMPLWIDLPEHGVRVVHAGVVPGVPIEAQSPRVLLYMRGLDRKGRPDEERGGRLWGEVYEGPPHMVFGHNALDRLQLHPWATGLDTGCVYGGALSALVLAEKQPPPPTSERRGVIVSVPARRCYADK